MRLFAFQPNETSISAGGVVTFQNLQSETHSIEWHGVAVPPATLAPGGSWSWRFGSPGIFQYRCVYDSRGFDEGLMTGRIVVLKPIMAQRSPESPGRASDWEEVGWGEVLKLGLSYLLVLTVLGYARHKLRPT